MNQYQLFESLLNYCSELGSGNSAIKHCIDIWNCHYAYYGCCEEYCLFHYTVAFLSGALEEITV